MAVQPLSPDVLNAIWQSLGDDTSRRAFVATLTPDAQQRLKGINADASAEDPDPIQRHIDTHSAAGANKPNALKRGT